MKELEAIVIPTGPSYEIDQQRAEVGIRNYNEDPSRLVFISGAFNNGEFWGTQPLAIYKKLRKEKVSRENIFFESQSHNTQENVLFLSEKLKEIGIKEDGEINNIIIATDRTHGLRFQMMFNFLKDFGMLPYLFNSEISSHNLKPSYSPSKAALAYMKDLATFPINVISYKYNNKKLLL